MSEYCKESTSDYSGQRREEGVQPLGDTETYFVPVRSSKWVQPAVSLLLHAVNNFTGNNSDMCNIRKSTQSSAMCNFIFDVCARY